LPTNPTRPATKESRRTRRPTAKRHRHRRLFLEPLEDRRLLTAVIKPLYLTTDETDGDTDAYLTRMDPAFGESPSSTSSTSTLSAATGTDTVLTSNTTGNDNYEVKFDQNWGQTFTISGTGTYNVDKIGLQLRRESDASSQTLTISLRTSWNGTNLWSTTISSTTLATSHAWYDFDVPSLNLSYGTQYFIRVSSSTTNGKVYWRGSGSNTYAGGTQIKHDGSTDSKDMWFRVIDTVSAGSPTATFTQTPTLASPLSLPQGEAVSVVSYVNVVSGSMPSNPTITATLKHGATTFAALSDATYNSGAGTLTWSTTLGSNVTIPAGQSIALEVTTAQSGVGFQIQYDSATKPSRIELPTTTFINIDSLAVYDTQFSDDGNNANDGTPITSAPIGQPVYVRAVVSDPFGKYDITGLDMNFSPIVSPMSPTRYAAETPANQAVYEFEWVTTENFDPFTITATAREGFEGTVSATAQTEFLVELPRLELTKSGTFHDGNSNGRPDAGETITYTFEVTNTGNVTLTAVMVSDLLATVAGEAVTLVPDATDETTFAATYVLQQADIDAGFFSNTATVSGLDPSEEAVTAEGGATVELKQEAALELVKSGTFEDGNSNGRPDAGETIRYTFQVTNTGNVTLTAVLVSDLLATVAGEAVTLVPDATDETTFAATYVLEQADIDAGFFSNTATVSGLDPSEEAVTAEGGATVELKQEAALELVKSGTLQDGNSNGRPDAGETIRYTFQVTNTGNVTLTAVMVSDLLATVAGEAVTLVPDETDETTFAATYVLQQADIDAGFFSNTATVSGLDPSEEAVTAEGGATVELKQEAALELVKSGTFEDGNSNGRPDAGETIRYTFQVTNTGNVTLTAVLVSDLLATVAGEAVTLVPDETDETTFAATYVLEQADIDAGFFSNTATVSGLDPSEEAVTAEGGATVELKQEAALELVKSGTFEDGNSNGRPDAGETIRYTFQVTNTGNVTLTAVMVSDLLATVAGEAVTLVPDATDETTFTATYVLEQADIDAGFFSNTATVSGLDPSEEAVTAEGGATVELKQEAALELVKSGTFEDGNSNGRPDAGETIRYTFQVTNTGNVTLTAVMVSDLLATVAGEAVTLVPDETDETTFAATYVLEQADIDAGFFSNTATVSGLDPSEEAVTAEGGATVELKQEAALELVKSGTLQDGNSNGRPDAGETIRYTFQVTNTGNVTLTAVMVSDLLATVAGEAVTLVPDETDETTFAATYVLQQADIDAGFFSNTATVSGLDPSEEAVTAEGGATVELKQEAALELVKSGTFEDGNSNGRPDAGETIRYTFQVTNTGNVTLTAVLVSDLLATVAGEAVTLVPDETDETTFTATYVLEQADIDAGFFSNTATVSGLDPSEEAVTAEGGATVELKQEAALELVKSGTFEDGNSNGRPDAGETIRYTFQVTNTGNVTLTAVMVSDLLATVAGEAVTLVPDETDETTFAATYVLEQADIDAGFFSNTATVSGLDPSEEAVTAEGGATVELKQEAALELVKSGTFEDGNSNGRPDAGETIRYTFQVTNTGNVTLTAVMVSDLLATVAGEAVTLVPDATDETTFTATYVLEQADIDAGFFSNTATVSGLDPSEEAVTAEGGATVELKQEAALELVKSGTFEDGNSNGRPDAGETIRYTFQVTNTGNVTLTAVMVSDLLATVAGEAVTLVPDETDETTFAATYVLEQADIDAGFFSNTATVSGLDPSEEAVTAEGGATVELKQEAALELVKSGTFAGRQQQRPSGRGRNDPLHVPGDQHGERDADGGDGQRSAGDGRGGGGNAGSRRDGRNHVRGDVCVAASGHRRGLLQQHGHGLGPRSERRSGDGGGRRDGGTEAGGGVGVGQERNLRGRQQQRPSGRGRNDPLHVPGDQHGERDADGGAGQRSAGDGRGGGGNAGSRRDGRNHVHGDVCVGASGHRRGLLQQHGHGLGPRSERRSGDGGGRRDGGTEAGGGVGVGQERNLRGRQQQRPSGRGRNDPLHVPGDQHGERDADGGDGQRSAGDGRGGGGNAGSRRDGRNHVHGDVCVGASGHRRGLLQQHGHGLGPRSERRSGDGGGRRDGDSAAGGGDRHRKASLRRRGCDVVGCGLAFGSDGSGWGGSLPGDRYEYRQRFSVQRCGERHGFHVHGDRDEPWRGGVRYLGRNHRHRCIGTAQQHGLRKREFHESDWGGYHRSGQRFGTLLRPHQFDRHLGGCQ
jgi:uncharacterized repeat protein (TIGR01451 family)